MRVTFTCLFLACMLSMGSLFAQQAIPQAKKSLRSIQLPDTQQKFTGFEPMPQAAPATTPTGLEKDLELIIGTTVYDLQSNSANCKRISMTPDGRVAAVWTQGNDAAAGYPGRGTGYNTRVDFAWGEPPTGRLEDDATRTGWPNHVYTADGGEFVVAHSSASVLSTLRRDGPTDAWTQSSIPSTAAPGLLWPRAASGGADGESIHVIAITTPEANGGGIFNGVDGHILYHRSTDGGATWDIVDLEIDGLGSEFTVGTDADSYYIDAKGDNVAFAVFNGWDDLLLFKSEDNGDTWTKTIVYDFPLERYVINDGYSANDLPLDGNAPDSLAIFSNDGFGTVLLDDDGIAHVFYGNMYVADADLTDAGSTYYPFTNGISYWNEFYALDGTQPVTVTGTLDFDGDGALFTDEVGVDNVALYFASLSSFPTAGLDANGNIYLVFSAVREDLNDDGNDNQFYRHLMATTSADAGETWTDPVLLLNESTVEESDFIDFTEAVYPTMVKTVDSKVRLIYQRDFRPGLAVRGDEDDPEQNEIMYLQVDPIDLGIVGVQEIVDPEQFSFTLAPTVTNATTQATFELPENSPVSMRLVNTHGQWVKDIATTSTLQAGQHTQNVDVSDLSKGIYYLVMTVGEQYSVVRLIKQ